MVSSIPILAGQRFQIRLPKRSFAALEWAHPISAFGGIRSRKSPAGRRNCRREITGKNTFFEAIIAPSFDSDAIPILTERKKWGANLRLLTVGDLAGWRGSATATGMDFKRVVGGVLVQQPDHLIVTAENLKVVTERDPTSEEVEELLLPGVSFGM